MNIFLCALALVSSRRPDDVVGTLITKHEIYYTDVTEHCFRTVIRLGRTWVEDVIEWQREVPLEECGRN